MYNMLRVICNKKIYIYIIYNILNFFFDFWYLVYNIKFLK